jgi:hypothetical protein
VLERGLGPSAILSALFTLADQQAVHEVRVAGDVVYRAEPA